MFALFTGSTLFYSIPRLLMYVIVQCKLKSYRRLTFYFRARIVTLFILMLLHILFFVLVFIDKDELALAYDSSQAFILIESGGAFLLWLGIDLYWSIAIRTYRDSKKGK